ncbi:alanine racemase [Caldisericum exile]|uniref:Alanine racemase n=1 Tax=Caldisericum exile (strain DSM 21853 / NBRC 104410 / AZM16c01) TaxID=511051 RepID=A0A7U6JG32_CALEA|nr:alanine racemase [Caldisericum exile]BAL81184.1 alanine racemase [Caldisericum exile AZM16c01]
MDNEIEMNRPTWVEVDLQSIRNNFLKIKEKVFFRDVICVVKADAYGLGASKIAATLEEVGADGFAVASMEEALTLRESQIKKPILVLGYVDTRNLHLASLNEIRITLFDKDFIKRLKEYRNETPLKIHVKIDTGMHRLGISLEEVPFVFEELSKFKSVIVEGVYTHFASADSDPDYTRFQISQFNRVLEYLKERNACPKVVHAANSAAVLNFEKAYYTAVRPGILLYGITPNHQKIQLESDFKEAVSIKTRIVKVSYYKKGERISYGGTYQTEKESLIATVPIGYADFIPRNLSNKGYVLVKGLKAPIVGVITMDMMMIDVTGFPYIHPGNEVVIVGSQGENKITMEEFATLSNTIPYEILTRLNKRIKRIYK